MDAVGESSPAPVWFVYLLRCANGALYTGITTDLAKRVSVHNAGRGSAYVRAHRPAKLFAFLAAGNKSEASRLECRIKALSRTEKLTLAKSWRQEARRNSRQSKKVG